MRAFFLIAVLALAGCQSAAEKRAAQTGEIDVSNGSMEEVSRLMKAARAPTAMQPGMWRVDMSVLSADLGIPEGPARDEQMAALKQQERHGAKCQGPEDLKTFDIENLEKVAGVCTFPHYRSKGGKLDIEVKCTQPSTGTTTVLVQGTASKTAFDIVIDQRSGTQGGADYAAIKLQAKGNRVGACGG